MSIVDAMILEHNMIMTAVIWICNRIKGREQRKNGTDQKTQQTKKPQKRNNRHDCKVFTHDSCFNKTINSESNEIA